MAANAVDLCTLAEVKTYMGITDSNTDDILQQLITAASQFANSYCSRILKTGSYTDPSNGTGGHVLIPVQSPITAVSGLTINDRTIPLSTGTSVMGYVFDDFAVYLRCARFSEGYQNVVLSYTAGYVTVPADLNNAVIELVVLKYRTKGQIGVSSRGIAGETISYTGADMSRNTRRVFNTYQRAALV